jgi:aminoglycoside/choline kinase family phosphotransferase
MGMQRHLKAAGIFARRNHRDGKPGNLGDIPRTLGYVVEVAARYDELAAFGEFVATAVMSRLDSQGGVREQAFP